MQHIVLEECSSTQSSFKEYWSKRAGNNQLLVSTTRQTQGIGRRGNSWFMAKHALAMSCSVKAQDPMSLTPLHLGVVVANFFNQKQLPIQLKWPNDLLNSKGEKVGGLLCQTLEAEQVLCGIGINLSLTQDEKNLIKADYPIGDLSAPIHDPHQLAKELYASILEHRSFSSHEWNVLCFHRDQMVSIIDTNQSWQGIFRGIDSDGCALLETPERIMRVFTGSLRIP